MKTLKKLGSLILLVFILGVFPINADPSEPNYSVKVQMRKRKSWRPEQITVSYIIVGLGEFEYGKITFFSDVMNIHINSYIFKQAIYTREGLKILATINNSNMTDELVANWGIETAYYETTPYESHQIVGTFNIDTINLPKGNYVINVVFTAKYNGKNYVFQDSLEYEIINIWDIIAVPVNVLSGLLYVLIGAGISYFVSRRTQISAWKREYSIKMVVQVYSHLFNNIKGIIESLKRNYYYVEIFRWNEMQSDHRYFMVDKKFRDNLDRFHENIEAHRNSIHELRAFILPKIIRESIDEIFGIKLDPNNISLIIEYEQHDIGSRLSLQTIDFLLSLRSPKDYLMQSSPDATFLKLIVVIPVQFEVNDIENKSIQFWELSVNKIRENKTFQNINENYKKLIEEAENIQKLITERIEETWKLQ